MYVKKGVGGFEKKNVSVLVWESQETHQFVTVCHDMTLPVKMLLTLYQMTPF